MFKVLIVDNEQFIREGLKLIIDWEQYGFVTCKEASDGVEGLKLIEEMSPDLVITDIKMPEMDGLEFIKRSKKILGSKAHFIILSGYNDFYYAQSAIQYNVIDYLLKPIEEDELIEVLKRVIKELKAQELDALSKGTDNMMKTIINSKTDNNFWEYAQVAFKNIMNLPKRYVQVEINTLEWFEDLEEEELKSKLQRVTEIMEGIIHKENRNCLYYDDMGKYGIILSENILKYYDNNIKIFVDDLFREITNILKCGCLILIGKEISELINLKISYKSCGEAKYYNHFYNNAIIFYDEVKKTKYNYSYIDDNFVGKFIEVIENRDEKIIICTINESLNSLNSKQVAPEIIHASFIIFISKVITNISKKYGNIDDFVKNSIDKYEFEGSNLEEIQENLIGFSMYILKYIKSFNSNKQTVLMYDIEKYIKNNYQVDITLKKLSEIFFINPVYLGQLFKKSLGMYFNDYLHYIRVEEAKKLLRRSNFKLYEIGNKVGYSDSNYFISKFERITGMSPTKYKNCK